MHISTLLILLLIYLGVIIALSLGIHLLFYLIGLIIILLVFYLVKGRKNYLGLHLIIIFSLLFPLYIQLNGLPLGVDPLRDLIYEYTCIKNASLPWNMKYFVFYYRYFPSMHLIPIFISIVSSAQLLYSHYIVLSILTSLMILPLYTLLRRLSIEKSSIILGLTPFIVLPSIATWRYWVIPMIYAITLMTFSLSTYVSSRVRKESKTLVISLILGLESIMTHPVVGGVLMLFYIVDMVVTWMNLKSLDNRLLIYNFLLDVYALVYWVYTGFLELSIKYFITTLNKITSTNIISLVSRLYTRSEYIPSNPPLTSNLTYGYFYGLKLEIPSYPIYYSLPRIIWPITMVFLAILIYLILIRSGEKETIIKSIIFYSTFLIIIGTLSLIFNLIWKADRYIISPASIYLILGIGISISLTRDKIRTRYFLHAILLILLISSMYDPRVAYLVNPFEGDRVNFSLPEKYSVDYLGRYYVNGTILSDYNLMTSYIRYETITHYSRDLTEEIAFTPVSNYFSGDNVYSFLFIFRRYSIESRYIWKINYMNNMGIFDHLMNNTDMIFNDKDVYILRKAE